MDTVWIAEPSQEYSKRCASNDRHQRKPDLVIPGYMSLWPCFLRELWIDYLNIVVNVSKREDRKCVAIRKRGITSGLVPFSGGDGGKCGGRSSEGV